MPKRFCRATYSRLPITRQWGRAFAVWQASGIVALSSFLLGSISMRDAVDHLATILWDNLGNCSFCIRKAFQVAASAWFLAMLFALLNWSHLLFLTFFAAAALTSLWTAHLVVYAKKTTAVAENHNVS